MTTLSAFALTRPADTRDHDRGTDWRERAECRDTDPAVFEPDDTHTPRPDEWVHPRSICAACPVREECLEDALALESRGAARFGMRGGATPDERQSIYRRRGRATSGRTS